jgi:hypothetical protein
MPMFRDSNRPPAPPVVPPRPPVGGNRPPGLRRTTSNMDMPFTELPKPEGYNFDPTSGGRRPLNPDTGMPWTYSEPEYPKGFLDEFQGLEQEFQGYGKAKKKGSRRPSATGGSRMDNERIAILQALLGRIGGQ